MVWTEPDVMRFLTHLDAAAAEEDVIYDKEVKLTNKRH
jgi:hypothetical protein